MNSCIKAVKNHFIDPLSRRSRPQPHTKRIWKDIVILTIIVAIAALCFGSMGLLGIKYKVCHFFEVVGTTLHFEGSVAATFIGGVWILGYLISFALSSSKHVTKKIQEKKEKNPLSKSVSVSIQSHIEKDGEVFNILHPDGRDEIFEHVRKPLGCHSPGLHQYTIIKNATKEALVFKDAIAESKIQPEEYGLWVATIVPIDNTSNTYYYYSFKGPFKTLDLAQRRIQNP